jgi:hypothetical protein
MKKFVPTLVLAATTIFTASAAYAAMTWSSAVNVSRVDVESDPSGSGVGEVYLRFSSNPHTTSCSGGSSTWVVGGNPDTVKHVHATALAAKLSGTTVKVLFNNAYSSVTSCSGGGTTGYPVLRGLEMQ